MIHGICEYAQRTSSLRMCNTLHENDACILHIPISSFVRDIFQDARAKLYNTELAISKLYGHVWTTWFPGFFSHWNSLPSWTELEQEPSNRLTLCWGYFTWKQHLRNTFLTCLYPWEAPFQMPGDFSWKISGVSAFQWFQEFEVFHDISQRDTAKWGPSTNPENLKMLALRHFGICGYLREFCGYLREFCGHLREFCRSFAENCGSFAGNFQRFRWQLSLCSPQPSASDIEKHPGHPIAFPKTKNKEL